ncbi:MAG: C4-type zinc ribbon domain-containing protein [Endomicrobium sp.]|jgi:predicted  nucleic acid-binding Zn-ribbon protein|nr:C4-type zinc ribbon domain-containing protein [Endomicrobium sp.]
MLLNLKQELYSLYELQCCDLKIDEIKNKLSKVPYLITEKIKILENKRKEIDIQKQELIKLNCYKKDKELLLDKKNEMINKRFNELNTAKSNDFYTTLLSAIEKVKYDKSIIEDEILDLMYKIDVKSTYIKSINIEFIKIEQIITGEINNLENHSKSLEQIITKMINEREMKKLKIDESVLTCYERLRSGCDDGRVISFVDGISCESCGIALRPQLINMVQKFSELVFCDNCSRILLVK